MKGPVSLGIVMFALIFVSMTVAGNQVDWNRTYGGITVEYNRHIEDTDDGGFIIGGSTGSYGSGDTDVWVIKTDGYGNESWNSTFGGSDSDQGMEIVQTDDGGYIVAGYTYSYGSGRNDFYVIKMDANGSEEWEETYGGANYEVARSIKQTSDGGYIIHGHTETYSSGYYDFWLVKIDENGTMEWDEAFGGTQYEHGYEVAIASNDDYLLIGDTRSYGSGSYDFWLIRTDDEGNDRWKRTYGGSSYDAGMSVIEASNGDIVMTGVTGSQGAGSNDVWVIRTNENGSMIWEETYGGSESDSGSCIRQTKDGGFLVTGSTASFGSGERDLWLIKIDGNGTELWNMTFGGSEDDWGYSGLELSGDGYAISGQTESQGEGSYDIWVIVNGNISIDTSNNDPGTPLQPAGPSSGKCGISYNYTTNATDPDGDEIRYVFDWGDGNTTLTDYYQSGENATAEYLWMTNGSFQVRVKAVDGSGSRSAWSETLTIDIENDAPITPSSPNGVIEGKVNEEYEFTFNTTDPEGHRILYHVDWDDGSNAMTDLNDSGANVALSHAWTLHGDYQIRVMAVDEFGARSNWSEPHNMSLPNRRPNIPNWTSSHSIGMIDREYNFTVWSLDPDNNNISFEFDWGDGSIESSGSVESGKNTTMSHAWTSHGTYSIRVRAVDEYNSSSNWTSTINMSLPNDPPTAPSIEIDIEHGYVNIEYNFTVISIDPNDDKIQYEFEWSDGNNFTSSLIRSNRSYTIKRSWTVTGDHDLNVRSVDAYGYASNWTNLSVIEITDDENSPPSLTINVNRKGKVGRFADLYVNASDPDGHDIMYAVKWGDGSNTRTEYYEEGTEQTMPNVWGHPGNYTITVRAWDQHGMPSDREVSNITFQMGSKMVEFFNNSKTIESEPILYGVDVTSDGGFIATGSAYTEGESYLDAILVKYHSNGTKDWDISEGGSKHDHGRKAIETSDGAYAFTGWFTNEDTDYTEAFLSKCYDNGSIEWTYAYPFMYGSRGYDLIEVDDGFMIAGYVLPYGPTNGKMWVVKTDLNGDEVWNRTYMQSGYEGSWGKSIQRTLDGGFLLGGYGRIDGNGDHNLMMVKLKKNADVEWIYTDGGTDPSTWGTAIQLTEDDYLIAGNENSGTMGYGVEIRCVNSTGQNKWVRRIGGSADDIVEELVKGSDGSAYLIGYTDTFGSGNNDGWVIRMNLKGFEEWNLTFGNYKSEQFFGGVLTGDGLAVVGNKWYEYPLLVVYRSIFGRRPRLPIADIPDKVTAGYEHILSAYSIDHDGDNISYVVEWGWEEHRTRSPYSPCNQTVNSSYIWNETGRHEVRVKAKDESGMSSDWTDTFWIEVLNSDPDDLVNVNFTDTGRMLIPSYFKAQVADPDGLQLAVEFDWDDGTTNITEFVNSGNWTGMSHAWAEPGTYSITARAVDPYGGASNWSEPFDVFVRSRDPDVPLLEDAIGGWMKKFNKFWFNVSDIDGDDVYMTVDWGDGKNTTTPNPIPSGTTIELTKVWSLPGNYTVKWMCRDASGGASRWSPGTNFTIYSTKPDIPVVHSPQLECISGISYNYTVNASDAEGDSMFFRIDWGDGNHTRTDMLPNDAKHNANHIWTHPGNYWVNFTAVDEYWSRRMATIKVKVSSRPPVLNSAPYGPLEGEVNHSYRFYMSASDPDGDQISYTINWGDGGITWKDSPSGDLAETFHIWTTPGTYDIEIKTEDSHGTLGNTTYLSIQIYREYYQTPGSPWGVSATAGNSSIDLSWNAPASDGNLSIEGYNIYRKSGTSEFLKIASITSGLEYQDTNISDGVNYSYMIKTVNSMGESDPSDTINATYIKPVIPDEKSGSGDGIPMVYIIIPIVVLAIAIPAIFLMRGVRKKKK